MSSKFICAATPAERNPQEVMRLLIIISIKVIIITLFALYNSDVLLINLFKLVTST